MLSAARGENRGFGSPPLEQANKFAERGKAEEKHNQVCCGCGRGWRRQAAQTEAAQEWG